MEPAKCTMEPTKVLMRHGGGLYSWKKVWIDGGSEVGDTQPPVPRA